MRTRVLVALVLVALAGSAHGFAQPKKSDGAKGRSGRAKVESPDPAPALDPEAEAARKGEVIARFEGGQITVGDLEASIESQSPVLQKRYADREALRALLEKSLRFELLAAEAARRGYDKHDAVVFSVKQNAVQAMLKKELDDKLSAQAIAQAELQQYYDEHIDEFVRPAMRRASHVQLATEAEAKALLEEAKAADVRAFRELARTKSTDETSKLRGGDLRYFDAKGRVLDEAGQSVDPAIAKAAFALKTVGDVAGPIKTEQGYSVVKLTGERPGHSETLKAAEDRIRTRLWRQKRQAEIEAMLEDVKKQYPTQVRAELLDAIKFESGPAVPSAPGLPPGFPQAKPSAPTQPK